MQRLKKSIQSCRLTTFGSLELATSKKKSPKKLKTTEKSPKGTKKHRPPRTTPPSVWVLSWPLSLDHRHHLEPYSPVIIVGAPLGAVGVFCGAESAALTNLGKKLSLKVTKHKKIYPLATAKHNSINALVSKSLNDSVVTDREFQIINSELEKYFELKEAVWAKLKVNTGPGPDIEKLKLA